MALSLQNYLIQALEINPKLLEKGATITGLMLDNTAVTDYYDRVLIPGKPNNPIYGNVSANYGIRVMAVSSRTIRNPNP